jgi:outer membrane protein TolC
MNAAKRQLKLALINEDASAAQALIDASNAIAQVEDTYWSLVAAWRNVTIQEAAMKEALEQQQRSEHLAQRGAAAAIEVVESQAQVAEFENNVFQALQTVSQLQNRLKSLVTADVHDPIWNANLVPSTSVQQPPNSSDLAEVISEGKQQRPEVRQAEDKRLQARIDVVFAANQSLPQADVQAQYQSNGFAGILAPVPLFLTSYCSGSIHLQACPTPPPNTQGSMPFAYHNMWAGYFPTFNIAFIVGYPLQGHVARGLRGVASEETTQARLLVQDVQERIGVDARNALQSYESALSKLDASRDSRQAAEAVYASEVRKFHNGESTTFLVLQRQVQLAQARGSEVQAQTQLDQSIVELQRVEGTILKANGVNVQTLGTQALAR